MRILFLIFVNFYQGIVSFLFSFVAISNNFLISNQML
jgi:hypothetical protein